MGKHKHSKDKHEDEECGVNEEVMEEIFKEVYGQAKKRRIMIRKPDGEVVADMPLVVSICLLIATVFLFFPVFIIALIVGYHKKLQVDVIAEVSDDEAQLIETADNRDTLIGAPYDMGDGQPTLIQ